MQSKQTPWLLNMSGVFVKGLLGHIVGKGLIKLLCGLDKMIVKAFKLSSSGTVQRWRKLPADFVNATQFRPEKIDQKSRASPEPKASQLNAGLARLMDNCSFD